MDREIWAIVMASIHQASRAVTDHEMVHRDPTWPNWLIVAMDLWRTWHGQSLSWACDVAHYGDLFRPRRRTPDGRRLPSISQFSRRVKADAVRAILQRVDDELSGRGINTSAVRLVDGKPVTVSPVSKDPDAAKGHVTGGFAKGYKLHAFVDDRRRITVWSVMPLNADEKPVAAAMVPHLVPAPPVPLGGGLAAGCGLTLADSNYDAAPLHKALARLTGDRLLAYPKGQHQVGPGGHHPVTLRQMGPERREALDVWRDHPDLAAFVHKQRNNIEGVFSVLAVALGLSTLPACVRRLDRVRRWVGEKIILYHARLLAQERAAAKAVA
jgi:hypothetical protein